MGGNLHDYMFNGDKQSQDIPYKNMQQKNSQPQLLGAQLGNGFTVRYRDIRKVLNLQHQGY